MTKVRNIQAFSPEQNLRLSTLTTLLGDLELRLAITPKESVAMA